MNITDPIRYQARVNPWSIAVMRHDGASLSYVNLDRAIDAMARRVLSQGLVAGNTVALGMMQDDFTDLVLTLAFARLGIACGPVSMPAGLADAYFTRDGASAPKAIRRVINYSKAWLEVAAESDKEPLQSHQDGAAVCRIFPSSGTTGTPKHVAVSHDLLYRRIFAKWLSTRFPDNLRQICAIGMETYYGFSTRLRVLMGGGTLVLISKQFVTLMQHFQVNCLLLSPYGLQSFLSALPKDVGPFHSLEVIEVGGSQLPVALCEMARRRLCPNIISAYGAMEAAGIASAPVTKLYDSPGAVGYVHPGVDVQAVGDDDQPLPLGTIGTIRVRSGNCVTGYLDDPEVSARVFKDGWFYPGDFGKVTPDGMLIIAGRASELINSGGVKVSPHVIEDALLTLPGVTEAAAFGVPDALGVTQIWAAVVSNGPVEDAALAALCRGKLQSYPPKAVIRVKDLPRNDNGKVIRDELVKLALVQQQQRAKS